jgi:hypothetical protein
MTEGQPEFFQDLTVGILDIAERHLTLFAVE